MRVWNLLLIAAVVAVLSAGCASNEPQTPQTEVDGPIVSEADFDPDREFCDEEVASFAAAYLEVTSIQQQYQTRIEAAEGVERQELSSQSTVESEEAMEEQGLTPEEYNAIAIRLPEDDELRTRVQSEVRQLEQDRIEETEQQLE